MAEKANAMSRMADFLDKTNKKYKKKYGENVLYRGDEITDFTPFPTGFPSFDWINSGIGGFPRGGMTLIHGLESTGKSTFVLESIKNAMEIDSEIVGLYIDVESSMTQTFLRYKSVIPERLSFTSLNSEDALNIAEDAIKENVYDIIVIDSLAKLDSAKIMEKAIGDSQQRNRRAVIITEFLRRITFILRKSKTALICINQEVANQDASNPYAPKTILPCGMQQKFSANLRIELKRTRAIKLGDKKVGYEMSLTSVKNKISNHEKAMTTLHYLYDRGFVREQALLQFLATIGYVKELTAKRYEFVNKEAYNEIFRLSDFQKVIRLLKEQYEIDLYDIKPETDFAYQKNEEYNDVAADDERGSTPIEEVADTE